ncbi:Poly [ADP-ribose] polymerase 1 [Forsythia ovata]|uniref:Poly [ADP-ribose] polymerase 1 n=1 Tax=Forsythia ovata TaxID=205694 RepID=A0ABD1T526_9LAMI
MANPPKPWKVEYAKSSRSSCKTCKKTIDKEKLRLGKMVQATQFDGFMPMWNHADCILRKSNQIKLVDDVEGLETLRWEDQQRIRKYVEGSAQLNSSSPAFTECGVEVSPTSRAACRSCSQKIMKGEIRISTKPEGQGARSLAQKLSKKRRENPYKNQHPKVGPRGKEPVESDQKSKLSKAGVHACTNKTDSENKDENSKASVLESQLETQTRMLWALKDDLKKHVTTSELREMLEANNQ